MGTIDEDKVRIDALNADWYGSKVATVDMLRLDLLHEVVSGNKWYKLRLNIREAIDHNYKAVLTFGGGYSNHLAATSFAAKLFGLRSIGIVRGRYEVLTPTLQQCIADGMQLVFVSQEDFKNKHQPEWVGTLVDHFDELYIVPEGGANEWGRKGAGLITRFIDGSYTHVAVAVGTGTTMIGLRNKLNEACEVIGFVPMKQGSYVAEHISTHLAREKNHNWQLSDSWHFGGFGKWNNDLISFMNDFYDVNRVPLDIVYTSKMMFGLREMIRDGVFPQSAKILCIHSGGLQGNFSVKQLLHY